MKLLITDGDERAALAAARSLGRRCEVHVAGEGRCSLAGHSRFVARHHRVADPLREPEGFSGEVRALVGALRAEVLLPVTDAAHRALLPRRRELEPCRLAAPPAAAYARLSDKVGATALARAHGIAVPDGEPVDSCEAARSAADRLGYPVVLKPALSVGDATRKRAVVIAPDARALECAWQTQVAPGTALLQRPVRGVGEGLFLLRWQRVTRAVFAHRRLREKPPAGGVSTLRESIAVDPALLARVEALLDEVDFHGVAMAEFKRDGPTAWLIEFNARLWGSLQLAIDSGVDFPRLLADAVLGEPPPARPEARLGVRLRWELGDLDHAIALARGARGADGRTGLAAALRAFLLPAGPNSHLEVLRAEDPAPFGHELRAWLAGLRDARRRHDRV